MSGVVADYLDTLKVYQGPRAGKKLSGNAKRLRKAAVKALLLHAYRQKHIDKLPELRVFRIKGSTRGVMQESEPLTLDELVELLEATVNPMHRAMFGVCAGEGLRATEVLRLEWGRRELEGHDAGGAAASDRTWSGRRQDGVLGGPDSDDAGGAAGDAHLVGSAGAAA